MAKELLWGKLLIQNLSFSLTIELNSFRLQEQNPGTELTPAAMYT